MKFIKKYFLIALLVFSVFNFFVSRAEAAIAQVQKTNGKTAGAATTVSASWGSATTTGNLLVAIIGLKNSSTITPPTVSGNAWTLVERATSAADANGKVASNAIYYIKNANSQSGSSSWTISSSQATLHLVEYSGINTVSPLDVHKSNPGTSSPTSSGTTGTTAQANEVAVSGVNDSKGASSAGNAFTITSSGWTEEAEVGATTGTQNNRTDGAFDQKILSATGTQQATNTYSAATSLNYAATIATFKEAPAAPGIPDMTAATDTGSSSTDNITSNTTPSFTISCTTGTTVTLFDNVTSVGTGTCVVSTVTITSSALSGGTHATMNAKQDGSVASANLSITIDTTADAAPGTPDMTAATDTGSSSTDNITSNTTPSFTISCVSGSTVTLFDNVTSVGTGACVSSTVTITSSALSEATHATMNAKQTDAAGNISVASGNLSIVIDATAPTLSPVHIQSNNANTAFAKTGDVVTLTFTSSESVSTPTVTIAGASSAVTGGPTAWPATHTMLITDTEGTVPFTINFTDLAGNPGTQVTSTTDSSSVTFDRTNPTSTITSPANNSTSTSTTVAPTGTSSDTNLSSTTISVDNGLFVATGGTVASWTYSATSLSQGAHTFQTKATDSAGNTGVSSIVNVTVQTATKFVILPPSSGTTDALVTVTVQAQNADNSIATSYQTDVTLNITGSATGAGLVNIVNGVGTKDISDAVAETVTLSLTDSQSTGLDVSSTQQLTFAPGALDHFTFDTISTQTGGTPFNVTITAKDANNNTVTAFTGTVDFTTNVTSIAPTQSSAFVNGVRTESVTLTGFGASKTITATDHAGTGKTGTSNSFTVNQANNPVPTTTSIFPNTINSGGSDFALTVNGANFVTNSVVKWNGAARATTFVSSIKLTATILTAEISSPGTANVTVTNPTPGGGDSNTQVFTITAPATKFVIINPTDDIVGNLVTVTIQAQDASNSIVTNYNNDVTLATSGNATGAGLVNITNGVGTINISDETAETVNLSLSDTQSTGLNVSSTQNVIFAAGPLFQFAINHPGDTTAGTRLAYTVTRKDQFGNLITSGSNTVYLYTSSTSGLGAFYNASTAGNVITSVTIPDASSSANFWYQEGRVGSFSVTVSDNSSAPDGTAGVDDASDSFSVSSGATSVFLLNDPGGMTVGGRLGYTVTRKDAFDNLATNGNDTVYLYSNSTGTGKAFYDAGIAGNIITSINIMNGVSSANFWYFDDTAGTWTITASDNSSAPDGAAGIVDATDDVTVNATPVVPTKIIILDPNNSIAGTATAVTVKAVDNTGAMDTTFNNTVTLNTSGSALGGGVVTITSGIGTVNINDNVAETVNLSLTDTGGTGLNVSSVQDVIFTSGPPAQFAITDPGNGIAGNRFNYTVTRKDQFGNLVTSGITTVYLYTNSLGAFGKFYDASVGGNVIISANIVNGQSGVSFWYEEGTAGSWTVTASDNNTAPDGVAGIADINDSISITPSTISAIFLTDPGNMSVNTRLGYTVTRKDAFGNLITSGPQNISLSSSSTSLLKSFYGQAVGGGVITSVTIPDGNSSAAFWYFDDTAGTYNIVASVGIIEAIDSVTVSAVPIVATELIISSVSNALTGQIVIVTINAVDDDNNIDTTFTDDVTLVATGSVTGEGLVHIVNGVGTKNISDTVPETATLSLDDTAGTGLDVGSTKDIIFSTVIVPQSGGGGGPIPSIFAINFSGKAFPGSLINILGIPASGNLAQAVSLNQQIAKKNGSFQIGLNDPDTRSALYIVSLTDKNHIPGQVKFFPNLSDVTNLNNIVFAPTISLLRSDVRKSDFLSVSGFANPNSVVEAQFDGTTMTKETTTAGADGSYKLLISTFSLELGKHSVRVRSMANGKATDFSLTTSFTVSNLFRPQVDLNHDGIVDVRDLNIFNYDWSSTDPDIRIIVDFNGDGKVDLQDLSIFTQALKH